MTRYSGSYPGPEVPIWEVRSRLGLLAFLSPRTPFLWSFRVDYLGVDRFGQH